jgi:hypothetical protein
MTTYILTGATVALAFFRFWAHCFISFGTWITGRDCLLTGN